MCLGDTILLEGINTTGVSYQWLDNGIPIDNANSVNHNISESGNYSLQLTDSLSQCVSNSTSFNISIIDYPSVQISSVGIPFICNGDIEIVANANGGNNLTYTWFRDSVEITTGTNNNLFLSETGEYYVNVENENNCNSNSNIIDMQPFPNVQVSEIIINNNS